MRNSLRVLTVLTIPALALGAASPAFAAAPTTGLLSAGQLASTGADVTAWIIAAIVFLGLGAVLFFVAQRQRVKSRANDAALAAALESNEAAAAVAATDTDDAAVDAAGALPETAPDAAAEASETPDATSADGGSEGGNSPA